MLSVLLITTRIALSGRKRTRAHKQPPPGVDLVTTALLIMIKLEKKNFSWENAKKMMAKVDAFKEQLEEYRGEDVPEVSRPCYTRPDFQCRTRFLVFWLELPPRKRRTSFVPPKDAEFLRLRC